MLSSQSRLIASLAIASAIALASGPSFAAVKVGDYIGKTEKEITASLEKHGFKIEEIDREGNLLEAEVTHGGKLFEFQADSKTGKVVEIIEGNDDEGNEGSIIKRILGIGSSE